jgi:hypothetical protein
VRVVAVVVLVVSLLVVGFILLDVFETIVLPRRVTRRLRPARLVYVLTWRPWKAAARRLMNGNQRESFLAYYGPLGLLALLVTWVVGLVVGFAGLHWALGSALVVSDGTPSFAADLYYSATTLTTLGLGDVAPRATGARLVTVVEAATGFGLFALVIGYLPALYQAFSRREVRISLLDARAGSPPTATEFRRRNHSAKVEGKLDQYLGEWEQWSAELLESHLSYPSLAYFRSQHDNQSWVAALTAVLDSCALTLAILGDRRYDAARLTFAIGRHAAVDLSQVFRARPRLPEPDRLPPGSLERMWELLEETGYRVPDRDDAERRLAELRAQYEPYVFALAEHLLSPLPPWVPDAEAQDDWQTSAEQHVTAAPAGVGRAHASHSHDGRRHG